MTEHFRAAGIQFTPSPFGGIQRKNLKIQLGKPTNPP